MAYVSERRKRFAKSDTSTKEIVQVKPKSGEYVSARRQRILNPSVVKPIVAKKETVLPARIEPSPLSRTMQGILGGKSFNLPSKIESSQQRSKIPYAETFKEVPRNIKSGNILGGLGNAAKGTGQMLLQGLAAPQKLVLNASKGIIDTVKGKKASFNPDITTESYLKDTGNAKGDKFYNTKVGQFAKGVFNLGSDPLTVVGGGIADDVLRATTKGAKGLKNLGNIGKKASEKLADNPLLRSLNDKLTTVPKGINTNLAVREALTAANKIDSANKPLNDLPTIKPQAEVITPSITKEVPTMASIKPQQQIKYTTLRAPKKDVVVEDVINKVSTLRDRPSSLSNMGKQEIEIRTSSGRHVIAKGYIDKTTKNQFNVKVTSSAVDSIKEGSIQKYNHLTLDSLKGSKGKMSLIDKSPLNLKSEFTPSTTLQKGLIPQQGSRQIGEAQTKLITSKLKPKAAAINVDTPNISVPVEKPVVGSTLKDGQVISKVKTNTIAKTDMLTQVEKNMLDDKDFTHSIKSETESLSEAGARLSNNYDGEVSNLNSKENFSGADIDTMFGIVATERDIARQSGDYRKVKSMLKNTRKAGTEGGRTIQAFAKYSRTVEGSLVDVQRAVDSVEEGLKKTNPAKLKKIDDTTKKVTDAIDNSAKEAAKQVEKEMTPELSLSSKIGSTLKDGGLRKSNPITDMVNELFKSAKEAPLPEKVLAAKRNPVEYLTQAIQNKGEYSDVWEKAKSILKDKYPNDSQLDAYFDKGIIPTYSDSTLNNSVQASMKGLGQKLESIAKSSNGDKEQSLKELTDYLVSATGSTTDDAVLLAKKIQARFDMLVKEKSSAVLKQMFKEIKPKGTKTTYQKVMELINLGAYEDSAIRDLIKQKEGLPILETDDIKKITEYMNKAKTFAEGSYDQRDMYGRVGLLIANKTPASLTTKIVHAPRMAMLGAMKTFFTKNFGGNIGNDVYEEFIRSVPSSIIDMVVSKIAKTDRTILFPSFKGLTTKVKGGLTGFAEQTKDIIRGTNTSPNLVAGEIPQGRIYKTKIFNAVDQFIRAGLQYGDRPTLQATFDEAIRQQKKILKTDIVTEDMKKFADWVAKDRVFQNSSDTAKGLGGLRTGINQMGKGLLGIGGKEGGVGNVVSPFINTAANIAEKVVDNTPIAAAKIYSLIRNFNVATGVEKTIAQRKLVDTLGRMITGTATVGLGIAGVKKGILTGRANKDADMANFDKKTGKQPYSIKLGDKYTPYTSLPPLSTALAIGSDIGANMKEGSSKLTSVLDGAKTGTNTFMQQSFLKGFSDLFGYGDFANGASRVATNYPSQWIPQTLNAAAKFGDEYDRQTYDPNSLKYTANSMQTKIPGKRQELPIKQNIFGEDTKNFNGHTGVQRFLDAFIYPVSSSKYNPTSVQKEIARLYDEGGTKIQVPTIVDKSILATKDHPKIELTAAEYNQYQKRTGQLTMNGSLTVLPSISGFGNVINSDKYKNAIATKYETVDMVKANMLAKEIEKAKAQAKKEILKARGYDK